MIHFTNILAAATTAPQGASSILGSPIVMMVLMVVMFYFLLIRPQQRQRKEQAARIAGVLTLWADLDAPEVTPQAMGWGITLAQYYLGEARRLAEAGLVSEDTAKAERLRKWLLESWPHADVLPSDILNKGPNALRERSKLTGPLGLLIKTGWLVALPEGAEVRGVSRKEAYRIVRPGYAE